MATAITISIAVGACVGLTGCGENRPVWRDQALPSGRTVKVTSCLLTWGIEHDERTPGQDSFALEFVSSTPGATPAARTQEAREVFELIRGASETWGFKHGSVAGFPTLERKGKYDLYLFDRAADGQWSVKQESRKVFITD
ncbi:MAG TPA: hypothetical protein DCM86_06645 [Verrucomicrobiales bacterium]|nr:hypothetical protein [Verrucomicrobiales bacterium]